MDRTLEDRVAAAVRSWGRWVPRWQPGDSRARTRPCRLCLGSPLLRQAGLDADVPHAVGHALATRLKRITDAEVASYTDRNLPTLSAELSHAEDRARVAYRPQEGLDPEFEGLPLDPEPEPGAPFLFTIEGLARQSARDMPAPPPLSEEAKAALRTEIRLADECGQHATALISRVLEGHRQEIRGVLARYVEPQIQALLADLQRELDFPPLSG
ncbi:hypothetical protein M2390_002852 [Mycetocola sp. BIGb0189]|uniref:spermidine/putrescine ABC transporter substrate-binding protein n=1 Tax=Mycetocola sp. BIGb0189 TaxID=2940604 RepID=UPI0021671327|nr:spermidine/putrescine ABC transporter substrate-binding protein [Mycetocola sp. BIGb0189]MCS4277643.1 hypothetical protein [Mycetocola sp. BIGb0189]